jgi:hypothetical protein
VEIKDGAKTVLKHRYDGLGLVEGLGRRSERNSGLSRLSGPRLFGLRSDSFAPLLLGGSIQDDQPQRS